MTSHNTLFKLRNTLAPREHLATNASDTDLAERGFVFILLAVFIPVLLVFGSLVIDAGWMFNARERGVSLAKGVALGYLERHFSEPCPIGFAPNSPECIGDKRIAAIDRAQEITGKNVIVGTGDIEIPDYEGTAAPVVITEGRWVICTTATAGSDEETLCQNRATIDQQIYEQIFVPIDEFNAVAEPDVLMNSVRVTGNLFDYRPMLAGLMGFSLIEIGVTAYSTISPRNAYVVVDRSSSMWQVSHPRYVDTVPSTSTPPDYLDDAPACGQGFLPAYPLLENVDPVDELTEMGRLLTWYNAGPGPLEDAPIRSDHLKKWRWLARNHPARAAGSTAPLCDQGADSVEIHHFGDDYRLVMALGDTHFAQHEAWYSTQYDTNEYPYPHPNPAEISPSGGTYANETLNGSWYFADAYAGSNYVPMQGVLEGVEYLIDQFRARRVEGDGLGLIMFDKGVGWSQFIKLTDNYDYMEHVLALDEPGSFGDYSLTGDNPNVPPSSNEELFELPNEGIKRYLRMFAFNSRNNFTNIQTALRSAQLDFAARDSSGLPSSYAVFLFSDMLSNCMICYPNGPGVGGCNPLCSNNYFLYEEAVHEEMLALAINDFAANNIAIHPVVIGDSVAPHTLQIQDPADSGRCLSDAEFRQAYMRDILAGNGYYVRGGDDAGAFDSEDEEFRYYAIGYDPLARFYSANQLPYQIAALTAGIFTPLRPVSSACGGGTFNPCDAPQPFSPDGTGPYSRQLFDVNCESSAEQMTRLIDTVLASNPYILVDEKEQ